MASPHPPVTSTASCVCVERGLPVPEDDWMIECDVCHVWFHGDCVAVPKVCIATIDKFHCPRCQPLCGHSILKPITNSHRLDPCQLGAQSLPLQVGTKDFVLQLRQRRFATAGILRRPDAGALGPEALLGAPVVVETTQGLGLVVPPALHDRNVDFATAVQPLLDNFGPHHTVDVIDSYKQGSFPLPLGDLCTSVSCDEDDAATVRPLNCLSLEISESVLGQSLDAPSLVRQMCWVGRQWTEDANWSGVTRPRVQKYCILSMTDSYTDFHVDFGGSSVWYHVLRGQKKFYLLEPTPSNLGVYERWQRLSNHSEVFLPELLAAPDTSCLEVTLSAGQTLFIPSGWIHAVLTTERAMVLGGNFLHELNMPLQWSVHEMEGRLNVPAKFRYPAFEELHWIVAWKWNRRLKQNSDTTLPPFLSRAKILLKTLKEWLSQDETMDDGLRRKKSALVKDLSKSIKKCEKGPGSGSGSKAGTASPTREPPALPKLKLTLSTKTSLDLTDRNNVRHLMQNPVSRSLENELSEALQDFDDQSDEDEQSRQRLVATKELEEEEDNDLQVDEAASQLQMQNSNKRVSSRQHLKRRKREELPTEAIRQVHQDDDFVYPALDFSDDEEMEELKKQERRKDGNWKPKAKIHAVERKTNRPSREGAVKIEVRKGLQEMAAKKVIRKKKKKIPAPEVAYYPEEADVSQTEAGRIPPLPKTPSLLGGVIASGSGSYMANPLLSRQLSSASKIISSPSASSTKAKVKRLLPEKSASDGKPKRTKGMATAKQRLGKVLKLKF